MSLKKYIDKGWWTIPIGGELKRLVNGHKSVPEFPTNWKAKYSKEFNRQESQLGGVLTGKLSNIIALDCDSEEAFEIFNRLDPDYKAIAMSSGKENPDGSEMKAGTIIYNYHPDLADTFKAKDLKLDFFSNSGMIYLPTKSNETKLPWKELPVIKDVPPIILALLKSLKPQKITVDNSDILSEKKWKYNLYPQVKSFVDSKKVTKGLFKIITPKDFRDEPSYVKRGFLHPKDVPAGRGSDYLVQVSGILGADISVDMNTYAEAMYAINKHFNEPMEFSRLQDTITDPMMSSTSRVNGKAIWQYEEDWKASIATVTTKKGEVLDLFFDPNRKIYYTVDIIEEKLHTFAKMPDLVAYLKTVSIEVGTKAELETAMPLVDVISTPKYNFGYYGEVEAYFNEFMPTMPLRIFNDPDMHAKGYNHPTTLLAFFEYLVPDNYMRNYLYAFLRRKFDTFDYTPVVLYFLGVSGSGKDLFAQIMTQIMGDTAMTKLSAEEFLEKTNGWIINKYFVQLDEYGDQLKGFAKQDQAKGILKALTGGPTVSARVMRENSFPYRHNITFIMTSNTNPFLFDNDDRRIALFSTPNKLRFQPKVEEMGIGAFVKQMMAEINDFMYWLKTTRDSASDEDYMEPPETADKHQLIATMMNAGHKLAYLFTNEQFDEIENLCINYDVDVKDMFKYSGNNKIDEDILFDLYMEMTEGQGQKRGLTAAMRNAGFEKIRTTRQHKAASVFSIPNLYQYNAKSVTIEAIKGDFE